MLRSALVTTVVHFQTCCDKISLSHEINIWTHGSMSLEPLSIICLTEAHTPAVGCECLRLLSASVTSENDSVLSFRPGCGSPQTGPIYRMVSADRGRKRFCRQLVMISSHILQSKDNSCGKSWARWSRRIGVTESRVQSSQLPCLVISIWCLATTISHRSVWLISNCDSLSAIKIC